MMRSRVVHAVSELYALKWDWSRLEGVQSDPFLSFSWITSWLEHFGGDAVPHVVVIERESGEVAGIVPLMLRRQRRRRMTVRVLCAPVLHSAGPARCGAVCTPSDDKAVIESFVGWLAAESHQWDVLELDGLPADGQQLALLTDAGARKGLTLLPFETAGIARVLAVTQPWSDYVRGRGSHFRRSLNDERRRLDRAGSWSFMVLRTPQEVARGMKDVLMIVAQHLVGSGAQGLLDEDRRVLAFVQDAVTRLAASGAIDLRLLLIDQRPIACLLSIVAGETVYPLLTKYAPGFEAASPGRAVIMSLVEDAASQGYREIDFLSDWNYLARFTDNTRMFVKLTAFHPGWYSRVVRVEKHVFSPWLHRLRGRLSGAARGSA